MHPTGESAEETCAPFRVQSSWVLLAEPGEEGVFHQELMQEKKAQKLKKRRQKKKQELKEKQEDEEEEKKQVQRRCDALLKRIRKLRTPEVYVLEVPLTAIIDGKKLRVFQVSTLISVTSCASFANHLSHRSVFLAG